MNRKPETIAFWRGRLPHWEVVDGRYFITLHVAGAIPLDGQERIRSLTDECRRLTQRESPEWIQLQRKVFSEMEKWLDRATRNDYLRSQQVAEMLMESIEHRCNRGDWKMFEFVVMPTHLHLFCEIREGEFKTVMEGFKRWSAHQAIKILGRGIEQFWQREWFDHWSRSDEQDEQIIRYIRNNPVKAGLVQNYTEWLYGGWQCSSLLPEGTRTSNNP